MSGWPSDTIRECSLAARGLLAELRAMASQSEQPGIISTPREQLAEILKVSEFELASALAELTGRGLILVTQDGLTCPHTLRTSRIRLARQQAGRKGGQVSTLKRQGTAIAIPKPTAPKPARRKANGPHQQALQLFGELWQAKYGVAYPFSYGKDGAHIKWMLEQVGGEVERLAQIFRRYLTDTDPFYADDRHTLGMLRSKFPRWLTDQPRLKTKPLTHDERFAQEIGLHEEVTTDDGIDPDF